MQNAQTVAILRNRSGEDSMRSSSAFHFRLSLHLQKIRTSLLRAGYWRISRLQFRSWNPAHNAWSQLVGQPQRQVTPDLGRNFKLGVGRRKVGSGSSPNQKNLVVQDSNFGSPLLFESVTSRPFFPAAEIKSIHAGLRGKFHQLPPEKIVGGQVPGNRKASNVVRGKGAPNKK